MLQTAAQWLAREPLSPEGGIERSRRTGQPALLKVFCLACAAAYERPLNRPVVAARDGCPTCGYVGLGNGAAV